jgi:hypothetical protein
MVPVMLFFVMILSLLIIIALVVLIYASFWRRRDFLPPDMFDGDLPKTGAVDGEFVGTFEEGKRSPVNADGFHLGGRGIFYIDEKGVNFLIQDSRQPVHLPFPRITAAHATKMEKGRRKGAQTVQIHWMLEDKQYHSVFLLDKADHVKIAEEIARRLQQSGQDPLKNEPENP